MALAALLCTVGCLMLGVGASLLSIKSNYRYKLNGRLGIAGGILATGTAITLAVITTESAYFGEQWVVTTGVVLTAISNIVALALFLGISGVYTRKWVRRKTEGLSDIIQYAVLKTYRELGFRRAYTAAVMGNHPSQSELLRGTHFAHTQREFLRTRPEIRWPVERTDELNELIWASIREHGERRTEEVRYYAPGMTDLFEEVYADLLRFSGRISDENIDRVLDAAREYGITAATHALDGDMPLEYLSALGIEPLDAQRQRFWWEKD